jgi:hypothetical protein
MLAIRLMQEQGIEVEALNFKTIFTCCQDTSAHAARDIGVRLTVVGQEDDYLELIKKPEYGYGKGANPCVDCRIYMFEKAKIFMEQVDAQFIISGEVLGQRPMSQKRKDLVIISEKSDLEDLLLRPLSAKIMDPTLPEREGWVDREKLYGFFGRSRKGLIRLAKELGLKDIPTPSTGCSLTEVQFSRKVHDLIQNEPEKGRWDFELLNVGRHFRMNEGTKVVVGRNQTENDQIEYAHKLDDASSTAVLRPDNFMGPVAMVVGPLTEESIRYASGLVLRYARESKDPIIELVEEDGAQLIPAETCEAAVNAATLASEGSNRPRKILYRDRARPRSR